MLVRLLGAHSCVYAHSRASMGTLLLIFVLAGENHLSFIETSALDASNVELAFQNILTGTSPLVQNPCYLAPDLILTIPRRNLPNRIQQGARQRRQCPGHDWCWHQHLAQQARR